MLTPLEIRLVQSLRELIMALPNDAIRNYPEVQTAMLAASESIAEANRLMNHSVDGIQLGLLG